MQLHDDDVRLIEQSRLAVLDRDRWTFEVQLRVAWSLVRQRGCSAAASAMARRFGSVSVAWTEVVSRIAKADRDDSMPSLRSAEFAWRHPELSDLMAPGQLGIAANSAASRRSKAR